MCTTGCTGHPLYNPMFSFTSSQVTGKGWGITYADGSGVKAQQYRDTVGVGGISVKNMTFAAVTSESGHMTSADGIL